MTKIILEATTSDNYGWRDPKYCDVKFEIEVPTIVGKSEKQINYAERLRFKTLQNFTRHFLERTTGFTNEQIKEAIDCQGYKNLSDLIKHMLKSKINSKKIVFHELNRAMTLSNVGELIDELQ